jgi:hydroxymethylglutaryl-CoA synthase
MSGAGIIRYGSYIPYFRLQRPTMGAGRGERAVASYDEDSVSMAVEAARDAIRGGVAVEAVLFATTSPAYGEKLDTATIQAALDLPEQVTSLQLGGSTRMGLTALLVGLDLAAAGRPALVCASDVIAGLPGGLRESQGGDGAVAFVTGPGAKAIARVIGRASMTMEILDVWRLPEERFPKQWEERFTADTMAPAIADTARRALTTAGIEASTLTSVILDGTNARSVAGLPKVLGLRPEQIADTLAATVGRTGAAHAGLLLARALDQAKAGDRILVVCEADGADALVLEVTGAIEDMAPVRKVDRWIASKRNDLAYNGYLKWRGILPFEPPRRPDPERPAAPPMRRHERWKLAFVGSRCTKCQTGHLPPQRVCVKCGAVDQMRQERFADTSCRVATYTLDHLAYSLQPPVVSAFVDYEGGGRFTCDLTDVDPAQVAIGNHLEMTFRRLFTAQGVHNYFWKARPGR